MSLFTSRQKIKVAQSVHNLSHDCEGDFKPGFIYPILCTKIIPGDIFQIASNPNLRTQPLVSPFFTNVRVDIRYFYCRNLLLWKNFDEYITNHDRYEVQLAVSHTHPYLDFVGARSSLQDYISGAIDPDTTYKDLDALPYRMYNMIYNEYYKDENLGKPANVVLTDGQDTDTDYQLLSSCYRKDYFTSALPFAQAGDPVALPASVLLNNPNGRLQTWVDHNGDPLLSRGYEDARFHSALDTDPVYLGAPIDSVWHYGNLDPNGTLGVDIDIREFRNANAIQRFLERSAVGGNRYAEYMLAHFGIKTPDNSSFRPQYLGGGETFVNVNPVEQNAPSNSAPTGTLAGKGRVSGVVGMNHKYFFSEYGWLMALMVIRPDAVYAGGINKQFTINGDRFDQYYNPAFQNIGMDEIKVKEIAYPKTVSSNPAYDPDGVFAYQERGFEYKTLPNRVHGQLANGSMKHWACTRYFGGLTTAPQFNADFVAVKDDCLDDQAAVSGYPLFFGTIGHNIIARRPMQYRAKYRI